MFQDFDISYIINFNTFFPTFRDWFSTNRDRFFFYFFFKGGKNALRLVFQFLVVDFRYRTFHPYVNYSRAKMDLLVAVCTVVDCTAVDGFSIHRLDERQRATICSAELHPSATFCNFLAIVCTSIRSPQFLSVPWFNEKTPRSYASAFIIVFYHQVL